MKLRFYYGTRPKLSIEDTDNFSRSDYKCRILLQTKRGAPVAISEHKDPAPGWIERTSKDYLRTAGPGRSIWW